MMPKQFQGAYWPTATQELLLRAAVEPGPACVSAWRGWRQRVDLDGPLEPGTWQLLPLVYRRLSGQGYAGPEMARLKGVYRYAWSKNQLLIHLAGRVLRGLQEAGFDPLILKGLPLSLHYYDDPALHPMNDIDILVPPHQVEAAYGWLLGQGWQACDPLERLLTAKHCALFRDAVGRDLDLHRSALREGQQEGADREFWAGSERVSVGGVTVRALNPADLLLHVCIHGTKPIGPPPVRWVADALAIIERRGPEIDWARLARAARERGLTLRAERALAYLARVFAAPLPPGCLRELGGARPSLFERAEYRFIVDRRGGEPWYTRAVKANLLSRRDRTLGPAGYLLFRLAWALRPLMNELRGIDRISRQGGIRYRQVPGYFLRGLFRSKAARP